MKPSSPHSPLAELPRKLACEWVYSIYAWRERSPEFMQTRVGQLEEQFRRAMLEFAERAEKATCAFCRSGAELVGKQHRLLTSEHNTTASSYSYYSYIDCDAAAIRELAEGLKENQK